MTFGFYLQELENFASHDSSLEPLRFFMSFSLAFILADPPRSPFCCQVLLSIKMELEQEMNDMAVILTSSQLESHVMLLFFAARVVRSSLFLCGAFTSGSMPPPLDCKVMATSLACPLNYDQQQYTSYRCRLQCEGKHLVAILSSPSLQGLGRGLRKNWLLYLSINRTLCSQ